MPISLIWNPEIQPQNQLPNILLIQTVWQLIKHYTPTKPPDIRLIKFSDTPAYSQIPIHLNPLKYQPDDNSFSVDPF